MVYLIHFARPIGHAQHYIGYCNEDRLIKRIAMHRAGKGGRLLAACVAKGIPFEVVRLWPGGDRAFERRLKDSTRARSQCPLCKDAFLAKRRAWEKAKCSRPKATSPAPSPAASAAPSTAPRRRAANATDASTNA